MMEKCCFMLRTRLAAKKEAHRVSVGRTPRTTAANVKRQASTTHSVPSTSSMTSLRRRAVESLLMPDRMLNWGCVMSAHAAAKWWFSIGDLSLYSSCGMNHVQGGDEDAEPSRLPGAQRPLTRTPSTHRQLVPRAGQKVGGQAAVLKVVDHRRQVAAQHRVLVSVVRREAALVQDHVHGLQDVGCVPGIVVGVGAGVSLLHAPQEARQRGGAHAGVLRASRGGHEPKAQHRQRVALGRLLKGVGVKFPAGGGLGQQSVHLRWHLDRLR